MLLTTIEWLDIVSRLVELTANRRVEWFGERDARDDTDAQGMVFRTRIAETTYIIGSVDADGSYPYYFEVHADGELFDRVSSPSSNRASSDELAALRSTMGELYKGAFRSFFRAPERAAKLIADLENLTG